MAYSPKVLDHAENPRNVGTLDKNDPDVGTGLVQDLQDAGFAVWRHKIEHVILDFKFGKIVTY